ncbi:hypothetical protein ACFL4T_02040 [candidate division KSB1 bacterium]
MTKKITLAFIMVLVFINNADAQKLLNFQNLNLGIGFNSSNYIISAPELTMLNDDEKKSSLYIDFQFDFLTKYGFNFKPGIGFWSWGVFDDEDNGIERTLDNYTISFDFVKNFSLNKRMSFFAGVGLSFQYLGVYIKIPDSYAMFTNVSEITENYFYPGYNFIIGEKTEIFSDFYLNIELRKENSRKIDQWKIFLGISMF